MPDTDLADDQAKWVRFSIWFLKRGSERILASGEDLVVKNFGADRYKVSKVFKFMNSLPSTPDPNRPQLNVLFVEKIIDGRPRLVLRDDVADLLDVRFEVVDRSDRDDLRYEESHIERLRGIEEAIAGDRGTLRGIEHALSKISTKIMPDPPA